MVHKFKVRAELDQVTKSIELERGSVLQVERVKQLIETKFGFPLSLRYKSADGRVQAIYQDFHLEEALKDCEKNQLSALNLLLTKEAASTASSSAASNRASVAAPGRTSVATPSTPTRSPSFSSSPATAGLARAGSFSSQTSAAAKPKFCEECGANLAGSGKFCTECGHPVPTAAASAALVSPRGSTASSDDTVCGGCNKAISGSAVRAIEKMWHRECFTCSTCHKSLLEGGFMRNDAGALECSNCYGGENAKKCYTCQKSITSGAYLNVEGRTYHKECFTCSVCNGPLEGGYFNRGGKPVCKNCV